MGLTAEYDKVFSLILRIRDIEESSLRSQLIGVANDRTCLALRGGMGKDRFMHQRKREMLLQI